MSDLQACSVLGNIKLVTLMSIKKTERCSRQQRRLESRERERESGQKLQEEKKYPEAKIKYRCQTEKKDYQKTYAVPTAAATSFLQLKNYYGSNGCGEQHADLGQDV